MNKKKLSVVMAGAMLASSVAPVLAAETTAKEYTLGQKKLLASEIKELMESKLISTNKALIADCMAASVAKPTAGGRFVGKTIAEEIFDANTTATSAYGVVIVNADGTEEDIEFGVDQAVSDIEAMTAGETLKVYERKINSFGGEIIPGTAITVADGTIEKYKLSDFTSNGTDLNAKIKTDAQLQIGNQSAPVSKLVKEVVLNSDKDGVIITLNALDENNDNKKIELKVGDEKLDFQLAYDKDGNLIDTTKVSQIQKFDHFGKAVLSYTPAGSTTEKELKSEYKVVNEKSEDATVNASELYDGLALTAKGTELLAELKNAADKAEKTIAAPGTPHATNAFALVQIDPTDKAAVGTIDADTGYYKFTVKYYRAKETTAYKTLTIRSTSLKELKSLIKLLETGTFQVGIVAGDNRYETAVNVAKTSGVKLDATASTTKTSNIVLVNGSSLVDGLAAAPLAATLNGDNNISAPVLLSQNSSLPTATREYLEELAADIPAKNLNKITVTLVGGKTVLTESLVDELEGMGFTVKRLGGDNREETSVDVARAINKKQATDDVFVVGANGEADAMSIAAVASIEDNETPIIVSKAGGISTDALEYIEDVNADGKVRLIGGETVLSKEDEEKINAVLSKTNASFRISGANRFETNAAIIKEYYKATAIEDSKGVVLVKDGAGNNSELVDALSAANYAASLKAPIVLATNSLSDAQKNAVLNTDKDTNFNAASNPTGVIAQVGQGVARTTLESVAKLLGVSNVK